MLFLIFMAIAAFGIWKGYAVLHRDEIKVTQEASYYNQRNYEEVYSNFKDAGFNNVQYDEQATLSMKEKSQEYLVTQVAINGNLFC